jgi:predicted  nucleic acid-binding Zn-ribbon protein
MLDKDDVRVLEKMFEKQEQKFDVKLEEVRGEIHALRSEMYQGFEKMRDDIIDVIEQNIQPQFTSLNARVTRLERRIA